MELVESEDVDKDFVANEIAVLENTLVEQQEFAELYEMQAETMKPSGIGADESVASSESSGTKIGGESAVALASKYKEELAAIGDEDFGRVRNEVVMSLGDKDNMVTKEETEAVVGAMPNAKFYAFANFPHPIEALDVDTLVSTASYYFLS